MCDEFPDSMNFCQCVLKSYTGKNTKIKFYYIKNLEDSVFDYKLKIYTGDVDVFYVKKQGNNLTYKGGSDLDQYEAYKKIIKNYRDFEVVINPEFFVVDTTSDVQYQIFNGNSLSCYSLDKISLDRITVEEIKIILENLSKIHKETYKNRDVEFGSLCSHKEVYSFLNKYQTQINDITMKAVERISQSQNSVLSFKRFSLDDVVFSYQNDKPVDCKFLVSEHYRCSPLELDFLQFLFTITTQELRQHHYQDLVQHYLSYMNGGENFLLNLHNYLPFVKLNTVYNILETEEGKISSKHCDESIQELKEIFVTSKLSREDCYEVIKNQLGDTNYKFLDFQLLSYDGTIGYLGDYCKLKIRVNHEDQEKSFTYFVKCMPTRPEASSMVNEGGAFKKELFFVTTFAKELREMGLAIIDDCMPKCFFGRDDDLLVFTDLSDENYGLIDWKIPYSLDIMKSVIKTLATFHGCMFLYEEINSRKLGRTFRLDEKYQQFLNEVMFLRSEDSFGYKFYIAGINTVLDVLIDEFPQICKDISIEEFKRRMKIAFDLSHDKVLKSKNHRNIINHGDFWATNIMLQKTGEEITNCKIVDFQLIKYCPPTHDLVFHLYINTSREIRLKHSEDILNLYYEQLSKVLSQHDFKISEVYSYEEFRKSIEYIRSQVVSQIAVYVPLVWASVTGAYMDDEKKRNDVIVNDRPAYIKRVFDESQIYRDKMFELVQDMYDLCVEDSYNELK